MSFIRKLLVATLAAAATVSAAEKTEEKKKETPQILLALPFTLVKGETNKIIIRGLLLTNAIEVRFPSAAHLMAEIKSRGKAIVPDKGDPKKLGDTQLEVALTLPMDFPPDDLPFTVSTPEGMANTNLLYVIARHQLSEEKEPNGSFRQPNIVTLPRTIRAVIQEANDVDVFRFKGQAGQRISIETKSARYASALDAILTLYDSGGHVLKSNDDANGPDARLLFQLPRDNDYFFAVNDAHDGGGIAYSYVVTIESEASSRQ